MAKATSPHQSADIGKLENAGGDSLATIGLRIRNRSA